MTEIQFTRPMLESLKEAYQQALNNRQDVFIWEGHEMLVAYAKYLIEFLEQRFSGN